MVKNATETVIRRGCSRAYSRDIESPIASPKGFTLGLTKYKTEPTVH